LHPIWIITILGERTNHSHEMRRTLALFAQPNRDRFNSARWSRDSIITIFRWQHEFLGPTGPGQTIDGREHQTLIFVAFSVYQVANYRISGQSMVPGARPGAAIHHNLLPARETIDDAMCTDDQ
jgi:hypothetical protein